LTWVGVPAGEKDSLGYLSIKEL